jgi:hypothetical protein
MHRHRATALAVWLLVALFLAAQFAGVVASPLTHATAGAAIADAGHHHDGAHHAGKHEADGHRHADSHRHDGCAHPDACPDHADYCCALHAFLAGILPPAAAIDNVVLAGETLRPAVTNVALGHQPGLIDRPPRSLS